MRLPPGWVGGGGEEEECPGGDDDEHGGDVVEEDVATPLGVEGHLEAHYRVPGRDTGIP